MALACSHYPDSPYFLTHVNPWQFQEAGPDNKTYMGVGLCLLFKVAPPYHSWDC